MKAAAQLAGLMLGGGLLCYAFILSPLCYAFQGAALALALGALALWSAKRELPPTIAPPW